VQVGKFFKNAVTLSFSCVVVPTFSSEKSIISYHKICVMNQQVRNFSPLTNGCEKEELWIAGEWGIRDYTKR